MSKHKLIIIALIAITFAAINISVINAQNIQDSEICYGYGSSDLQPKGIGNTVFPYTEKIGFWVQIQNPADVNYRIIWIDPDDSQYRNQPVEIVKKSGADWGIAFDSINIAETTAKNKLGVWDVELYIDGELRHKSYHNTTLTFQWNKRSIGIHTIVIQAQDTLGHISTEQVKIWMLNI